ncbi:MAG: ATP-dependent Clp protease ATP-binding subunit [Armatimonadetes bacterium]|nr:ATP-dependent Clp protease ATP-binding subunit [Armatimonadota bacterium]
MWQRFTERARKCVFYAQEFAQSRGEGYVSTEHLLFGLLKMEDSVARRVLETAKVPPSRVSQCLERQIEGTGNRRESQDMTLTPRAKRVIDLAYNAARDLNNNYIGTEHILLGLMAERDGRAGKALTEAGCDYDSLLRATVEVQKESPGPPLRDYAPSAFVSASAAVMLLLFLYNRGSAWKALTWGGHNVDGLIDILEDFARDSMNSSGRPRDLNVPEVFRLAEAEKLTVGGVALDDSHMMLAMTVQEHKFLTSWMEANSLTLEDMRELVRRFHHLYDADA